MTEKYQPIPHRLKNMAVGGHVAGAVDILDDLKDKDQQTINAEQDLTNQQTAIDIDDLNEDFENLEDLVNEKQMEIGATEFDVRPKSGSTHPVTSGGIYTHNIEAEIVVGDPQNDWQPATAEALFERCQEAISRLNGNDVIPVADHTAVVSPAIDKIYREQGETSYTDWMYYGNTWYEIATYEFPGIDHTPVKGSSNLIDSNSVALVKKDVDDIKPLSGLKYDRTNDAVFTDSKRVNYQTGKVLDSETYAATEDYIDISGYEEVLITMPMDSSGISAGGIAFYEEMNTSSYISGRVIQKMGDDGIPVEEVLLTIPQNANYLRTTWFKSTSEEYSQYDFSLKLYVRGDLQKEIDSIETRIEDIEEIRDMSGSVKDISNDFSFDDGYRIHYQTGSRQENTGTSASKYCSVEGYTHLVLTMRNNKRGTANGLAFYSDKENETYVSGIPEDLDTDIPTSYMIVRVAVPTGAKFVRTTWWPSDSEEYGDAAFVCKGIVTGELPDKVSEIDERTKNISNIRNMSGVVKDITVLSSFTDGYRINFMTGVLQDRQSTLYAAMEDYIYLEGMDKVLITVPLDDSGKTANGLAFYSQKSQSSYISGYKVHARKSTEDALYEEVLLDIPEGANYLRTTWFHSESEQYSSYNFSIKVISSGELQVEIDNINKDIKEIKEDIANAGGTDTLPDYYLGDNYIEGRINDIVTLIQDRSLNSDIFFWVTDPHCYDIPSLDAMNGLNTPVLINYIRERINIRKVFCGGDLTANSSGDSMSAQIEGLKKYRKHLNSIWKDTYMVVGNHEWNNPGASQEDMDKMLDMNLIYEMLIKDKENCINAVDELGDYYIDNPVRKIRYFFVGCEYNSTIAIERVTWVAQQLLNVPSGYTVVVISHLALTDPGNVMTVFKGIADVLDAAKAKTSIAVDNMSYNYSTFAGNIACVICGHNHVDADGETIGGIPVISTTCDRLPKSTSSEEFKAARVKGTVTEQAIDVYLIDTDARKINTIRIGGSFDYSTQAPMENPDREFSY